MLIAMIADIEPDGVAAFRAYEKRVLALLERHGGRVRERLGTAEGTTEIHVIEFASAEGYDAYMADPARLGARDALAGVRLVQRVLTVVDLLG